MWDYGIGFERPGYLLLLVAAPVMWALSYRTLAGLGRVRRVIALLLRTAVFVLLVAALAEAQWLRTSSRMTVIYLLDQSQSIPSAKRQLMFDYVVREVAKHRNSERGDRAGVIVFGREAMVEIPPFDGDIPALTGIESYLQLRTDATNLEAALKLAQASFPEDSAKRLVIVSDGNENLGDARTVGSLLADQSIAIDVAPVTLATLAEIMVERVDLPSEVRRGQPTEARVILHNYSDDGHVVRGRLTVTRRAGGQEQLLAEQDVELQPGKQVLRFEHEISQPALYTYRAVLVPEDPENDLMAENNQAEAITHVRGRGRVLLIEDAGNAGDFDFLTDRLRESDLEVDVITSSNLFSSLADLRMYDTVVLANTPRSSGDSINGITNFSDEQIRMLVRNTQQLGGGLVMLGGPESFGAGGWANTELEKAMPVDFQIKNAKIEAVGALVLMMHASEMPSGNYWQKIVGREAVSTLGPMDYCGVLHWDNRASQDAWLWGEPLGLIRVGTQLKAMLARLNRMAPGDMPNFEPAMKLALNAFSRVNAATKHMIVISDGDPPAPTNATISQYASQKIKVSTVAVGAHGPAGHQTLQDIATATGGTYYVVTDAKALPRIFQFEARRAARPLVYEPEGGVTPQITQYHEMLQGIPNQLPPIRGFLLTTLKDSSLVEASIVSPKPDGGRNSTILASWTYGHGRTVAFTTDAGKRWANQWTDWENYSKFFSQMVRWSMRPLGDEGQFAIATSVRDGMVDVSVTALDQNDEFLNLLDMSATAIGPDLQSFETPIRQVAAGRYVGRFPADKAGSYFLTLNTGGGGAPLITGITVPYSSEFRDRSDNRALLTSLSELAPRGGEPGEVLEGGLTRDTLGNLLEVDTFRHNLRDVVSRQAVWPLFVLMAAGVFFADIFLRRVAVSFLWIPRAARWLKDQILGKTDEVLDTHLQRLRSRKAAVTEEMDQRRASARMEIPTEVDRDGESPEADLEEALRSSAGGEAPPKRPPAKPQAEPPTEDAGSYTDRLLEAKRRVWKDKRS